MAGCGQNIESEASREGEPIAKRDPANLSAGAVALSSSATFATLMQRLRRIGAVSDEAEREICEQALLSPEEAQGDDDSGVFTAARELIEQHLRPSGETEETA